MIRRAIELAKELLAEVKELGTRGQGDKGTRGRGEVLAGFTNNLCFVKKINY